MPDTPLGFPYPPATDPVAQGAAAIQALAERVDGKLGLISHTEYAVPVTVTAVTEATAHVVATAPVYVSDGVLSILIEFYAGFLRSPAVAGHSTIVALFEDGVAIGRLAWATTPVAVSIDTPCFAARRRVPAAGNRTYSVRAYLQSSGSGLVGVDVGGAAKFVPGYLRLSRG